MPIDTPRLLTIDALWDGTPAAADERAEVVMLLTSSGLVVEVTAAFHADPPPTQPPGRTEGLWNYEVVELFLANERDEYLELELGPYGHYLALQFSGVREVSRHDIEPSCWMTFGGNRWQARARVPSACLPTAVNRANAYAIHGRGVSRRFLAAYALPGESPDFHQPRCFKPLGEIPAARKQLAF